MIKYSSYTISVQGQLQHKNSFLSVYIITSKQIPHYEQTVFLWDLWTVKNHQTHSSLKLYFLKFSNFLFYKDVASSNVHLFFEEVSVLLPQHAALNTCLHCAPYSLLLLLFSWWPATKNRAGILQRSMSGAGCWSLLVFYRVAF